MVHTVTTPSGYAVADVRAALPALRDVTYLNVGTEGIMAEPVLHEHLRAVAWHETHGHYGQREVRDLLEQARTRLAQLLDVVPDELALTTNATDGVNLVAFGLTWRPDDEVVLSDQEHPAMTYPFFSLQQRGQVRVRFFHVSPNPAETVANFRAALNEHTRLAAFSHVSCETGVRLPAATLCAIAREHGALTLLDGAQSVGQFPVQPRALNADFMTGNGHKWLCGPKGTGFLYVASRHLADLAPPYVGAGSLFSTHLAERQYDDPAAIALRFESSARRYEFGTRNLGRFAALATAIDYLEQLGWPAIWRHQATLAADLKARLAALPGATVHTPADWEDSCGLVTVSFAGVSGADLAHWLWTQGIVQRRVVKPNGIRFSCAYFTNTDDLNRVEEALRHYLRRTRPA